MISRQVTKAYHGMMIYIPHTYEADSLHRYSYLWGGRARVAILIYICAVRDRRNVRKHYMCLAWLDITGVVVHRALTNSRKTLFGPTNLEYESYDGQQYLLYCF
jgi:hypothetical protein